MPKHWTQEIVVGTGVTAMLLVNLFGSRNSAAESLAAWQLTTSLVVSRTTLGVAAANGWLYAIGGTPAPSTQVSERAAINANGSLQPWQTSTALTTPRQNLAVVSANGEIYALGGQTSPGGPTEHLATVEHASIYPDGSLGAWTATSAMTTRRVEFAAVTNGTFVYALGGYGGAPYFHDTVDRAEINPDGSLGPWALDPFHMTTARYGFSAAIGGNHIYVFGGTDGTIYLSSIESCEIMPDGSLGPWQIVGSLPSARVNMAAVVVGGFVYIIGGFDTGPLSEVDRAEVRADGSLGAWETMTPMTIARHAHAGVAVGSNLYALSGYEPPMTGTVEYTSILGATPTSKDECKDGGWAFFTGPPRFRNQGQCVSFVARQHPDL
ncbi:MAG: hypothetical protein HYX76_03980 [Acidobacteria bacterium]|nr:hypothetical protein [Acidobacteriota bacterium]